MNNQTTDSGPVEGPEIEALRQAFDTLPEHYRKPMTLYYFGGLNQGETAEALGAPLGTVAKQLARGLEHLRARLTRAGFAVTSAGLLALLTTIPTYAASPEFKASLIASRRLEIASRGGDLLAAKSSLLGSGLITVGAIAVIGALVANAVIMVSLKNDGNSDAQTMASDSGLIAHWFFDDGQGTIARNQVGDGSHGTLVNKPTWIPGKIGGALRFSSSFDNHIVVPSSPALNSIKNQMTVAAWVFKLEGGFLYERILGRRMGAEHDDLWVVGYDDTEPKQYVFRVNEQLTLFGPSSLADCETWVHLCGTYDGIQQRLYRNGILVAEKFCSGTIPDETSPVVIGAGDGGFQGIAEFLNGAVDDVRLYNRALSDAEVADLAR
jgi:hypothetical protein